MKVDNLWEYSHYEGELKKLCFHSLKKNKGRYDDISSNVMQSINLRDQGTQKTEIQTCFLSHIPSFPQNKALQYAGQTHRCPMKLSQTQIFTTSL